MLNYVAYAKREERGFSLLEIIIVGAIIAIIAVIAIPSMIGQRDSAKFARNIADVTEAGSLVVNASALEDFSLHVEGNIVAYQEERVSSVNGVFLLATPMTEDGFFCLQLTDEEGSVVHSTPAGSFAGSCGDIISPAEEPALPTSAPEATPSENPYTGPVLNRADYAIDSVSRIAPPAGVFNITAAYTGAQYSLAKYGSTEPPFEGTVETLSFLIGVPYVYANDIWVLTIVQGPYTETYSITIEDNDEYIHTVPPLEDPTGTTSVGMQEDASVPEPVPSAEQLPTVEGNKVIFCQSTNSNLHPYLKGKVSKQGIINGHLKKAGPLYPTTDWGDIIPPFDSNPGQNWTAAGRAIFNNNCIAV